MPLTLRAAVGTAIREAPATDAKNRPASPVDYSHLASSGGVLRPLQVLTMPTLGQLPRAALATRARPLPNREGATTSRRFAPLGPWQPVRLLGRGRKTIVFQARPIHASPTAPADYVIKALDPDFDDDSLALAALKREALVAGSVTHPNLPVLLASQLQRQPCPLAFLHARAVSGRRLLGAGGADDEVQGLKIPRALRIVRQAADALRALHEAGWLHGDVKPDNLLVAPDGKTTLIDLGFTRRLEDEECACSEALSGSCIYTAPEMIVPSDPLTAASDIYSLGITLFELLTGSPPMETRDRATVVSWHLRSVAPELRERLPHAPLRLARLLRAMLARQPLRRPSLAELLPWLMELEIETLAMQ